MDKLKCDIYEFELTDCGGNDEAELLILQREALIRFMREEEEEFMCEEEFQHFDDPAIL